MRHPLHTVLLYHMLGTVGCLSEKASTSDSLADSGMAAVDGDGDGHAESVDCDDGDADVFPGAPERCNGLDDDCDGTVDEEPVDSPTWYVDGDGDGYGTTDTELTSCERPGTAASVPGDCDDGDATVYPGAEEVCDGSDEDCDGQADEDAIDAVECVPDEDRDGHGQDVAAQRCCALGDGWVAPGEADCDDADRAVSPSGLEACNLRDDDCDDEVDEDEDGDDTVDTLCDLFTAHVLSDAPVRIVGDADTGWRSSFLLMDANADGYVDLWLGAESASVDGVNGAGLAYLLPGPLVESGLAADLATAKITGAGARYHAGHRLDNAGDLDGDGYPELWIAQSTDQSTEGIGSVQMVMGPVAGELSLTDSDLSWIPDVDGWSLYYTDLGVGDYDGDDVSDLIIGASVATGSAGGTAGMVWVVRNDGTLGPHNLSDAPITLEAQQAQERVGYMSAIVGSTTGDGVDDLLISGVGTLTVDSAGLNWIVEEPPGDGTYIINDIADATLVGEHPMNTSCAEVVDLGDMNGDGYGDYAIGAPMISAEDVAATGGIYLIYGPTGSRTSLAEADARLLGIDEMSQVQYIAGDADVDADGHPDLVAGAFDNGWGTLPGTAFLVRGPIESGSWSLADADAQFDGEAEDHMAGSGLSIAGDTNGDGYPDVAIGAAGYEDGTYDAGAIYLYFGQPF